MLLLEDGHGGVIGVRPTLRDRAAAGLRADRIDRQLARGVSPDASVELALRAQTLTRTSNRRGLARGLQRVIEQADATTPTPQRGVPVRRSRVSAVVSDLRDLSRTLLAAGPVSVQGVAQIQVLLTTGWGPLYDRRNTEGLSRVLRRALRDLTVSPGF